MDPSIEVFKLEKSFIYSLKQQLQLFVKEYLAIFIFDKI